MATITTRFDVGEGAAQKIRIWKALTITNGDVLVTGMTDVWAVLISDPSKWAAGGWSVGTGTNRGKVTFNLSGSASQRILIFGR
jgi:hypothetical protein